MGIVSDKQAASNSETTGNCACEISCLSFANIFDSTADCLQDSDIFFSACVSGDEDEVEELIEKGANVNTCTIDGVTVLHQVCCVFFLSRYIPFCVL